MKKIPTVFCRNYETDRLVRDEVTPGCEWVLAGEGVATLKMDGTCCLIRDGKLYKRYDAKKGKAPPADFEPTEDAPDEKTGHWPGWLPVGDGSEDRWHREAWEPMREACATNCECTCELIGPKVQGNPHGLDCHQLRRHGEIELSLAPRDFEGLRRYLATGLIEGLVFHHQDGRMAKIKCRDFGLPWPVART